MVGNWTLSRTAEYLMGLEEKFLSRCRNMLFFKMIISKYIQVLDISLDRTQNAKRKIPYDNKDGHFFFFFLLLLKLEILIELLKKSSLYFSSTSITVKTIDQKTVHRLGNYSYAS